MGKLDIGRFRKWLFGLNDNIEQAKLPPEVIADKTSKIEIDVSKVQQLDDIAQSTAVELTRRGVVTTRYGDGKGTFLDAWDLHITFNSIEEEGFIRSPNPRDMVYREFYTYDQLLLGTDGRFLARNCRNESINNQDNAGFQFRWTSGDQLARVSDLSIDQIFDALRKLIPAN